MGPEFESQWTHNTLLTHKKMKTINVLELTKALNTMRVENTEMTISEFRTRVKKLVSYHMFASYLLDEQFAYRLNSKVVFSTKPIYKAKVEKILKEARESQYTYTETYKRNKKVKNEKIKESIEYLKSLGYIIVDPKHAI